MAVIYSVFSILPGFEDAGTVLRDFVFDNFVPQSAGRIEEFLIEFSGEARNLTLVGTVLLVVSTILLLMSVEHAFNHVWGVTEARHGLVRLAGYWGVVTLGPVLVGIGILASSYLATAPLLADADMEPLRLTVVQHLPELSAFLAISLLFRAMPNCHVPLHHALVGGLVATGLIELAEQLFILALGFSNLSVIYGAFAVLPLFLLWMYLVWSIVLAAAILVASLSRDPERHTEDTPVLLKCLWLLEFLAIVHPGGSHARELARQTDLTKSAWSEVLDALIRLGLVRQQGQFLQLGHSARQLPLLHLYQRFPEGLTRAALRSYRGSERLIEPLMDFIQYGEQALSAPIRLPDVHEPALGRVS